MNLVLGLDIAKEESQVQACLKRKSPYKKSSKFKHDLEGLHTLLEFYRELEKVTEKLPTVIMESTGHYLEKVVQFLEKNQIAYILVNPIISHG